MAVKASEVLEQAIDILKPKGAWCQNEYVELDGEKIKAHCAIGGLREVTHGYTIKSVINFYGGTQLVIDERENPKKGYVTAYKKALDYLADECEKTYKTKLKQELRNDGITDKKELEEEVDWVSMLDPANKVIDFNDSSFGNKKAVLAAFKRALKKAVENGD